MNTRRSTQPRETLASQLEFALKHEGVNLAVLADLFRACGPAPIEEAVSEKPTGRYRRLMGSFYERLTGERLVLSRAWAATMWTH